MYSLVLLQQLLGSCLFQMNGHKFVGIVILFIPVVTNGYSIPDVTVQALKTGAFRAYIPDSKGITVFAPHGKINERIAIQEVGDFFVEIREKTGDYWIAEFPQARIKAGDTVYLWVSVIVDSFGYRKEGINVTIGELLNSYPVLQSKCVPATTVFSGGKPTCIGDSIILEEFQGPRIDSNKWIIEQWIPINTPPNFLFNSYENRDDVRFIKDGKLYIKPFPLKQKEQIRGPLDLTNGCTSKIPKECSFTAIARNLLPPIKSGKITSKVSFKYGKVEIRAKLPAGEWLFPIVQLEQKVKDDGENSPKVWIAYIRGNDVLIGANQNDIGSRLLIGGPVRYPSEPGKGSRLVTSHNTNPFYQDFHVYTLEWIPGRMTFKVDGTEYGSVDVTKRLADDDIDLRSGSSAEAPYDREYVLTLGVGAGGLLDFPDGFTSGTHQKPWQNDNDMFISSFFDKTPEWSSTWKGDSVALQVDYVKVTAM